MSWLRWTQDRCEWSDVDTGSEGDVEALDRHLHIPGGVTQARDDGAASVLWIHLCTPEDRAMGETLLERLRVPASLQRRIHAGQSRAQVAEEEDCLFVQLQSVQERGTGESVAAPLRILITRDCLLSIEPPDLGPTESLRAALRARAEGLRHPTAEHLLWRLLDAVVAHACEQMEARLDAMERLEETLLERQARDDLVALRLQRRSAAELRRAVVPLEDLSTHLLHREGRGPGRAMQARYRDLHAHAQHAVRRAAALGQASTDLLSLYLSISNTRMQGVVRMLTGVSTLFLPLSFVTGVYGMNFRFMPELGWRWSYPVVMVALALSGAALFVAFRRKEWL